MVLVKATASSETGQMPSEQLMIDMGRYNEELVKAGIMKAGEGLKPSSQGVRVRFSGSERSVANGPFSATNELVAGFWIWEVQSMDEAVEWVKRCPNPMPEESEIEIRPIFDTADFAESDPTGEIRAHEEGLRIATAARNATVRPYLFFGGRCDEALAFYQKAIGAQVGNLIRFNESPDPVPEGLLQSGFENKVMHSEFTVGDMTIMASDGCDDQSHFSGFRLVLSVENEEDARRMFDALAEEGNIDLPLCPTFWSPCYGQVTDRFNVGWMVMVPGPAA